MKPFIDELEQHRIVINQLNQCQPDIEHAAKTLINTLEHGGKILLCGNGGSAADCQHIAAEFVVRYVKQRRALAAIALTTDTSILTAHPNDFEFDTVFARQVEALGREEDCLIAISTSGNSANVLEAAKIAQAQGLTVIAMTGETGGALAQHADLIIKVPSNVTARIQEAHILIAHYWCDVVEDIVC
ncbi:D-sedoheptulose 7-phosphate isomerase [Candidatus Brocadiaceae bacterium]|nr:D-sedoheptulose 7-phosphate isomerase [Candidatus Brocadiaceae bacterium]